MLALKVCCTEPGKNGAMWLELTSGANDIKFDINSNMQRPGAINMNVDRAA